MNHWEIRKLCLLVTLLVVFQPARSQQIWLDGTVDTSAEPPGKLLSDNADYWGEVILTGVDYRYPHREPDSPPDNRPDREGRFQRTLLNGNRGQSGNVGVVGMKPGHPLEVEFDFKRDCTFKEIDLVTPPLSLAIRVETRPDTNGPWEVISILEETPGREKELHRVRFDPPRVGRQMKLVLNKTNGPVRLREFIAWGDAVVDADVPELFAPVAEGQYPVGTSFPTLTGIAKSCVSDREAYYWVRSLPPDQRSQKAVWAPVPTWDSISHQPLLPAADQINQPIHIVMARNETEAVALALKSTVINSTQVVKVVTGPIQTPGGGVDPDRIHACLGVLGVIGSRNFGNNLGPILQEGNLPGRSLLRKFLLNGDELQDYPHLTLPKAGGVVCWFAVSTDGAAAGIYHSSVGIEGGQVIPVTIEVLDVLLPRPFALVNGYNGRNRTVMFPFNGEDRIRNDIGYALDCGISVWSPDGETFPVVREMAAKRAMKIVFNMGNVNPYKDRIWQGRYPTAADLPPDTADKTATLVSNAVAQARALGLAYDEWYATTGDEPGAKNMGAIAEVCRLIKAADPNINIYLNPCYWTGYDNGAVSSDDVVAPGLLGWYETHVDISMPLFLLLEDRPRAGAAFSAERLANAYYYVSGHLDRSESGAEIQKYRRMAWNSFSMRFNGWGFYSYYSPRGSAWNHFDRNPPGEGLREPSDYQMVYPGPHGVIRTRHSEALREGWEDWCLLNLLRDQGQEVLLQKLMEQYRHGTPPAALRMQALHAAASIR